MKRVLFLIPALLSIPFLATKPTINAKADAATLDTIYIDASALGGNSQSISLIAADASYVASHDSHDPNGFYRLNNLPSSLSTFDIQVGQDLLDVDFIYDEDKNLIALDNDPALEASYDHYVGVMDQDKYFTAHLNGSSYSGHTNYVEYTYLDTITDKQLSKQSSYMDIYAYRPSQGAVTEVNTFFTSLRVYNDIASTSTVYPNKDNAGFYGLDVDGNDIAILCSDQMVADVYGDFFLSIDFCNEGGGLKSGSDTKWNRVKNQYNNYVYHWLIDKDYIKNTVADNDDSASSIAKAIARYDNIVYKRGKSNFLDRALSPYVPASALGMKSQGTAINVALPLLLFSGIAMIGAFIVTAKKRR